MWPPALAAMQPCRLSAARSLMARMIRQRWTVDLVEWDINRESNGEALYRITTPRQVFDFVVISRTPTQAGRTPRIIAGSWDMQGALIEGPVDRATISATRQEMPKLYAGRAPRGTLIWCRSNRSMRAFDIAVDALAQGRQPDLDQIAEIGYLMRNTGLDGNGTFGTRSFLDYGPGHELALTYHAQMLCVYMMREFGIDLANHLARCASPTAVALDPRIASYLGVGNGSALGLVLWTNNHPRLVDAWIRVRERAISRMRSVHLGPDDPRVTELCALLDRAARYRQEDRLEYGRFEASADVAAGIRTILAALAQRADVGEGFTIRDVEMQLPAHVSREARETLYSCAVNCLVSECEQWLDELTVAELQEPDLTMSVADLRDLLRRHFGWAARALGNTDEVNRFVWYKSRNAEEPRRGRIDEVPPATIDLSVNYPRELPRLSRVLDEFDDDTPTASVVLKYPGSVNLITRVQTLADHPYHAPHMDMADEDFQPVDVIRMVNVALFGLDKTKDYLGRNLRGLVLQGAPVREYIRAGTDEIWYWPPAPAPVLAVGEGAA